MKSDKDFVNLGKAVGTKFKDSLPAKEDNLNDENLALFMEELYLCVYK